MARTLAFGAALVQGAWPCQEDGFFVDPSRRLFAVADGFGGRGAGDMAAKLALAELKGKLEGPAEAALTRVAQGANKLILERNASRPVAGRGGASFVAGWADAAGEVNLVHTGATAAFLYRAGALSPLLVPQAGPREEYQALLPSEALGLSESVRLESRSLRLRSGDLLFLASGGVDWESEAFRQSLFSQAGEWVPGASPEALVRSLVENASMSAQSWNRTLVAIGRA